MPTSEWKQTACILCECNCGIEVQLGRDGALARIRGDKAHPASQGYTCNKALPARPLPERPPPPDGAAAAARRRQLRGDRLGHRDPRGRRRASRRCATPTAASRSSITAAAARATTSAAPTAARSCARSASRYRSSALAQEKMGEFYVDAHLYGGHTARRLRALRGRGVRRQEPLAVAELPARARRRCARSPAIPSRAMIVLDPVRTETAELADFHLRVRPGTDAWCLAALLGDARAGGPARPRVPRRAHDRLARPSSRRSRDVPVADCAARCGVDEELIRAAARRIAGARERRDVRGPRHPAGPAQRRSAPTSTSCSGC